jgi:hypothetical protein
LRELGVLCYGGSAFTLERLLTALKDCESRPRKPSAVCKELNKEWWQMRRLGQV